MDGGSGDVGEAKIDELDAEEAPLLAEDHEVGGLEVAVNDAALVDGFEGSGALDEQTQGLLGVEPALAGEEGIERFALEVFEHVEREAIGAGPGGEGADHMGVANALQGLGLAGEALDDLGAPEEGDVEDLDGHGFVGAHVFPEEHVGHGALAEEAPHGVAPGKEATLLATGTPLGQLFDGELAEGVTIEGAEGRSEGERAEAAGTAALPGASEILTSSPSSCHS
jgi:hypothetical protein